VKIANRIQEGRIARIKKEIALLESMETRLSRWDVIRPLLEFIGLLVLVFGFLRYVTWAEWSTLSVVLLSLAISLFSQFWFLVGIPGPTSTGGIMARILLTAFVFDPFSDGQNSKRVERRAKLRSRIESAIAKRRSILKQKLHELGR
jgi:hypothetical protein